MKRKIKEAERLLKNFDGLRHYSQRIDALNIEIHYTKKRIEKLETEVSELLQMREILKNRKMMKLSALYDLMAETKQMTLKLEKEESKYQKLCCKLKRVRKLFQSFGTQKPAYQ